MSDQVGLVAPVEMTAKMIFQQLWCRGVGWDEPVDCEIQTQVSECLQDLQSLDALRVPRAYFSQGWWPH